MLRRKKYGLIVMVGGLLALNTSTSAAAASANISHSYHATSSISNGFIVSLDPSQSDFVVPASTSNAARLLGVAVKADDSLLAVNSGDSLVQVATDGTATVLVSTVNGAIKLGDQVAVSPFNGVGMEAPAGSRIIGLAQTSLDTSTPGSSLETVKDASGKSRQIRVGYVRMSIAIGVSTAESQSKLNGLQRLVLQLRGHVVSTARIVISLGVAVVALAVLISLIYSAIYSTIVGISRNPLAEHSILNGLLGVVIMSCLVAGISMAMIYFLLG